jgi:dihydrofolate synthase/folylpolyglutamate synthase
VIVAPEELSIEVPALKASLDDWLAWLETIHPVSIDMGLTRVGAVADRLQLRPVSQPLVLVGGTNGKGSTIAMLSAIYSLAGYKVGAYTSPHIEHFCERIQINQHMVEEHDVVEALAFVETQRAPQTLTYFEYTTLAAMRIFMQQQCDIYLFEVGLGGRLDATNLWDADCAVLTSIALDHESYLGSDLSVIATEKTAIGRAGKPLIVGDLNPPASLFKYAAEHKIIVNHVGARTEAQLPRTSMTGTHQQRNAACAVAAVAELAKLLPVSEETISQALMSSFLSARFERIAIDGVDVVLDVAHNPAGAQALAESWQHEFAGLQAEVIFAALSDKDLKGVITELRPVTAAWHCIELDVPRASTIEVLRDALAHASLDDHHPLAVHTYKVIKQAWIAAHQAAVQQGRSILITGSFHTVAAMRGVIAPDS